MFYCLQVHLLDVSFAYFGQYWATCSPLSRSATAQPRGLGQYSSAPSSPLVTRLGRTSVWIALPHSRTFLPTLSAQLHCESQPPSHKVRKTLKADLRRLSNVYKRALRALQVSQTRCYECRRCNKTDKETAASEAPYKFIRIQQELTSTATKMNVSLNILYRDGRSLVSSAFLNKFF